MESYALKKDTLYETLRREILAGKYSSETRFPKELDFCRQLGVGKVTLRSALEKLEADGLVARIPGKGTFIRTEHRSNLILVAITRKSGIELSQNYILPGIESAASAMGFQYVLIDCAWDVNIGYEKMEELVAYAHSKHVDVFLWYSSSGYWNDIVQSPTNQMDNPIVRKKAMKWLKKIGVKGIKVDFFGGDKQETMRLYEAILSDADDYGLMVIFHGCTLPRGWERMYPNYVGSEAVLASENLVFQQHFDDMEAFNACLHPFIRNTVGCMEFGGTFLNKRYNRTNDGGSVRKTTDIFQLATAVLFQNPIQNFAITPNNLTDAPQLALDFLREVPTTWDETVFLDGYPGKYVVLARRHADRWYIAGINAGKEPLKLELNLPMCRKGDKISYYSDTKDRAPQQEDMEIKRPEKVKVTLQPEGGIILVK